MRKNLIKSVIAITIVSLVVTGCGKKAKLKDGSESAVSVKKTDISTNDYYNEIKKENVSKLVDMVDHKILDDKYKTDSAEDKEVEAQIKQIKSNYSDDEEGYKKAIKQYFGVSSEKELDKMLRLEYKRNKAIKDHVNNNISDSEIKKYYDEKISGDIKASHILIKVDVDANAGDKVKKAAEEKALKEAEKVIDLLNKGKSFKSLAKKYSDDEATKNDGGNLGYFSPDEMEENFAKAVKDLKKGKYSLEPVKTQYGYHIILKVDEKKKASLKSVKEKIKETLTQQKLTTDPALHYKALIDIRKENNVKWNDKDLEKAYNELMDQLIESANNPNTN
ncbi:MAG: peptidylprolyl isomerase [Bacilli bacterium]|nr:peptidylprolyl isomerase [Bacilli bacterium]